MNKNLLNVKTALCALMMAAAALTSCNKDDDAPTDNYSQVSGMTAELQGYLGKDTTAIDAAMKAKGYTVRHNHNSSSSRTYYSTSITEKRSFNFSFEGKWDNSYDNYTITGGVINASYSAESNNGGRRDAYLSQFEAWGTECAALKFEDSYSSNLKVVPSVTLEKYDSNKRDEFTTAYTANKGNVCEARESFSKYTAASQTYQSASCEVYVHNTNYSVSISVSRQ
ncbi:MAG: hypothetical protein ACRC9X_07075 [Bacteroidales bacterium]